MSNKKATKRALLTSILAICLCLVMLIGSTFAWFTDTASTSVNQIQSGTLKVGLQMKDNEDQWVDAEGETLQFKVNGKIPTEGTKILWEPGCTYELPALRVVNKGNLALKYKIQITGIQGNAELNKVITWTINDADISLTEQHLEAKAEGDAFIIKGHMQETAGNDYQDKSIDGISITVLATQDTVEFDSISDQYDKDATFPWRADATVEKGTETVVKDKEVDHNVKLTAPVGSLNTSVSKVNLVVVEAQTPGTISVGSTQGSMSYEVTLKDQNGNTVAATGETLFEVEMQIGKNRDSVKMYHDGVLMTDDGANLTNVAERYVYDKATGYVTMKVSHFSPFTAVYNLGNWTDSVSDSYTTPVDETNKVVTISNAAELALFAKQITDDGVNYSGYTVNITNNIDLGANLWEPINGWNKMANIVINGSGHMIRNMTICSCTDKDRVFGAGFIGDTNSAITIKDITFDNANVDFGYKENKGNVGGIVMGYTYGTTLFENVTVTNSTIRGFGKIGCLLGMGADPGVSVTFKNCVSRNNAIDAAYNMGGLAGNIQRKDGVDNTKVENCTVENVNVVYSTNENYITLDNAEAAFKSNDVLDGTDAPKTISGVYWDYTGYGAHHYFGGYADYYVSYGNSSYDPPIDGKDGYYVANSEYCVNK